MPMVYLLGIMMLVMLAFDFTFYAIMLYFVVYRVLDRLDMSDDDLEKKLDVGNSLRIAVYLAFLPFLIFMVCGLLIGFLYSFLLSFLFGALVPMIFRPMSFLFIPGVPGIIDNFGLAMMSITYFIPLIQLLYVKKQLDLTWIPSLIVFGIVWLGPFLINFLFIGAAGALPMFLTPPA
ncbi:MAG: hypothetical protein ACXQS8_06320 [Candidatus Helarchaeales archaeon]